MFLDEAVLKAIIEAIVDASFFCYGILALFSVWVMAAVFDAVDAYKWRRKMPIVLAAEMIKQTEEMLSKDSFEYGVDYE